MTETLDDNREAMLRHIGRLQTLVAEAKAGGGAKYVARHHERGRLLARERVELLVDRSGPFLELSPTAAAGSEFQAGASVITGVGLVSGVPVMVMANDPTVRGGATNPYTMDKILRAFDIAEECALPVVFLVESGGADLPTQAEYFLRGGGQYRQYARLSAQGVPTMSVVFGNATAGGAYHPGMSEYVVMVKGAAHAFLGGPPLVQMATGEISDAETLGGADMHARVSGLCDYLAENEPDALRIARKVIAQWQPTSRRLATDRVSRPPAVGSDVVLDLVPVNPRSPIEPVDLLKTFLDGSEFEEFKPLYGTSMCTGWGTLCGINIGVVANRAGAIFSEDANKSAQFIQICNKMDIPILFVQNTTGFMVGAKYERAGIIKHGAQLINVIANSKVPHLTLMAAASYGAGNYGMSGRAFRPRFVFAWPNSRTAVMGAEQLAGVMVTVRKQSMAARGDELSTEEEHRIRTSIEEQIRDEEDAFVNSARIYDDGVIDPRDTRWALGMALLACRDRENPARATDYGVFRM